MEMNKLRGNFRARAIDSTLGETNTGTEEVGVIFQLTGDTEVKGQTLPYYGYFTEKTFESTVKGLRACGWQGTDPRELLDFKASNLGANEVELVIEPEVVKDNKGVVQLEADGVTPRTRSRVRWINTIGRGGLREPMAADKAAAFAEKMRARLVAYDQNAKAPKNNGAIAPTPPSGQPAVDPGEVPF